MHQKFLPFFDRSFPKLRLRPHKALQQLICYVSNFLVSVSQIASWSAQLVDSQGDETEYLILSDERDYLKQEVEKLLVEKSMIEENLSIGSRRLKVFVFAPKVLV